MKTKEDWKNITEAELYDLALMQNIPDNIIADMYGITKNMVTYKRHKFGLKLTRSSKVYRKFCREKALQALSIIPDSHECKDKWIRDINSYYDDMEKCYT